MGSEYRRKINRARSFRSVKAPYRLDGHRIHIHGFGTVAPARRNGKRNVYARLSEFIRAGGGFGNSADSRVGDDYLHVFAVGIKYVVLDKFSRGLRHVHSLIFEAFANFNLAASAVDGRSYTDYGIIPYKS